MEMEANFCPQSCFCNYLLKLCFPLVMNLFRKQPAHPQFSNKKLKCLYIEIAYCKKLHQERKCFCKSLKTSLFIFPLVSNKVFISVCKDPANIASETSIFFHQPSTPLVTNHTFKSHFSKIQQVNYFICKNKKQIDRCVLNCSHMPEVLNVLEK